MYKTNVIDTSTKITVDLPTLAGMLGVGKTTAIRVGKEAKAVIKIGRRTLYNVAKVQAYMEGLSKE